MTISEFKEYLEDLELQGYGDTDIMNFTIEKGWMPITEEDNSFHNSCFYLGLPEEEVEEVEEVEEEEDNE